MSYPRIRYWRRFSDKIISISNKDGAVLQRFLQISRLNNTLFNNYEILDFQHYRKYRSKGKILTFLQMSPEEQRFKFLVGRN